MAYHGLIPERVETITSITPKKDKEFQTPLGCFTYRYLAIRKYPHGIEQVWLDQSHPVLMASPEKALCDYIELKKISEMRGVKEARDFLLDDLRISRKYWKRFNGMSLLKLNQYYRSKNIYFIQQLLQEA